MREEGKRRWERRERSVVGLIFYRIDSHTKETEQTLLQMQQEVERQMNSLVPLSLILLVFCTYLNSLFSFLYYRM